MAGDAELQRIMRHCWEHRPEERPSMAQVQAELAARLEVLDAAAAARLQAEQEAQRQAAAEQKAQAPQEATEVTRAGPEPEAAEAKTAEPQGRNTPYGQCDALDRNAAGDSSSSYSSERELREQEPSGIASGPDSQPQYAETAGDEGNGDNYDDFLADVAAANDVQRATAGDEPRPAASVLQPPGNAAAAAAAGSSQQVTGGDEEDEDDDDDDYADWRADTVSAQPGALLQRALDSAQQEAQRQRHRAEQAESRAQQAEQEIARLRALMAAGT